MDTNASPALPGPPWPPLPPPPPPPSLSTNPSEEPAKPREPRARSFPCLGDARQALAHRIGGEAQQPRRAPLPRSPFPAHARANAVCLFCVPLFVAMFLLLFPLFPPFLFLSFVCSFVLCCFFCCDFFWMVFFAATGATILLEQTLRVSEGRKCD